MVNFFPEPILNLPKADIPIDSLEAYLSQGVNHQILFMEFENNVELPEHSHEAQYGIILKGKIEITIDGLTKTYQRGDTYFIPKDINHSAKIYAGYADITFFNQRDRYKIKQ